MPIQISAGGSTMLFRYKTVQPIVRLHKDPLSKRVSKKDGVGFLDPLLSIKLLLGVMINLLKNIHDVWSSVFHMLPVSLFLGIAGFWLLLLLGKFLMNLEISPASD